MKSEGYQPVSKVINFRALDYDLIKHKGNQYCFIILIVYFIIVLMASENKNLIYYLYGSYLHVQNVRTHKIIEQSAKSCQSLNVLCHSFTCISPKQSHINLSLRAVILMFSEGWYGADNQFLHLNFPLSSTMSSLIPYHMRQMNSVSKVLNWTVSSLF